MSPRIEEAGIADAGLIAALVNTAYRSGAEAGGWTHEAALVAGPRISAGQVHALFATGSAVLVMRDGTELLACVHVERAGGGACRIGLLATSPALQNDGIGRRMLDAAEQWAGRRYAATVLRMSVLSHRPELLAYYQRRGYALTGGVMPYPTGGSVGVPLHDDLRVFELEKRPAAQECAAQASTSLTDSLDRRHGRAGSPDAGQQAGCGSWPSSVNCSSAKT